MRNLQKLLSATMPAIIICIGCTNSPATPASLPRTEIAVFDDADDVKNNPDRMSTAEAHPGHLVNLDGCIVLEQGPITVNIGGGSKQTESFFTVPIWGLSTEPSFDGQNVRFHGEIAYTLGEELVSLGGVTVRHAWDGVPNIGVLRQENYASVFIPESCDAEFSFVFLN
jgi:hypothetical protein